MKFANAPALALLSPAFIAPAASWLPLTLAQCDEAFVDEADCVVGCGCFCTNDDLVSCWEHCWCKP